MWIDEAEVPEAPRAIGHVLGEGPPAGQHVGVDGVEVVHLEDELDSCRWSSKHRVLLRRASGQADTNVSSA